MLLLRNKSVNNPIIFLENYFDLTELKEIFCYQVTSPLTHNISGTAKAAAQTVMATQWNAEIKTGYI
jgi:hypothetical protein